MSDSDAKESKSDGHGPFHRVESPTQTPADAEAQVASGELHGHARKAGAPWPSVKAYVGPLPEGKRGLEFFTSIAPRDGTPPGYAEWPRVEAFPDVGGDDNIAIIPIRVTKNTQTPWAPDSKT